MTNGNELLRQKTFTQTIVPAQYSTNPKQFQRDRPPPETWASVLVVPMPRILAVIALAGTLLTQSSPTAASPSLDDRVPVGIAAGHVAVAAADYASRRPQPISRAAPLGTKPGPSYNGYYGPVGGTSTRPKPVLFSVGGWW
jgi:hypothetical protein